MIIKNELLKFLILSRQCDIRICENEPSIL